MLQPRGGVGDGGQLGGVGCGTDFPQLVSDALSRKNDFPAGEISISYLRRGGAIIITDEKAQTLLGHQLYNHRRFQKPQYRLDFGLLTINELAKLSNTQAQIRGKIPMRLKIDGNTLKVIFGNGTCTVEKTATLEYKEGAKKSTN